MKTYTDIAQSKEFMKLGILMQSYDGHYDTFRQGGRGFDIHVGKSCSIDNNLMSYREGLVIPAWSLAALFDALPEYIDTETFNGPMEITEEDNNYIVRYRNTYPGESIQTSSACLLDAVFSMILTLNEKDLL